MLTVDDGFGRLSAAVAPAVIGRVEREQVAVRVRAEVDATVAGDKGRAGKALVANGGNPCEVSRRVCGFHDSSRCPGW